MLVGRCNVNYRFLKTFTVRCMLDPLQRRIVSSRNRRPSWSSPDNHRRKSLCFPRPALMLQRLRIVILICHGRSGRGHAGSDGMLGARAV
jgi:hypothetical protein